MEIKVIITGDQGAGKTVFANWLHQEAERIGLTVVGLDRDHGRYSKEILQHANPTIHIIDGEQ